MAERNRLIFGNNDRIARWVADQLPHMAGGMFATAAAIGVERGSTLIAGIVYHGYNGGSDIQISMAATSPRWAEPGVIAACLHYPFVQLKCRRVTCLVPQALKRVHRFLVHLGFQVEGISRYGFDLEPAVTFGMVREECRWIPIEFRNQMWDTPKGRAS